MYFKYILYTNICISNKKLIILYLLSIIFYLYYINMSISESQDNSIFVGVRREYYELGKLKSEVFVNAGKKRR